MVMNYSQGKEERERQARVMAEHLRQCFLSQGRKWIILFPEGGFLRNRLETSQRSEFCFY